MAVPKLSLTDFDPLGTAIGARAARFLFLRNGRALAADVPVGEEALGRLDKLDAVLAQTSTSIEDVALFAEILSLPNDGRYPALDLAAEQRRQRTLEARC